jgi:hypothetical protein
MMAASQGATDPAAWGAAIGNLGPMGMLVIPLVFALAVFFLAVAAITVSLTGIRRFGVPGLAYVLGGLWRELHGLRSDFRAHASQTPMEPLEPIDEERFYFPAKRKPPPSDPPPAAAAAPVERIPGPPSQRRRERSSPR